MTLPGSSISSSSGGSGDGETKVHRLGMRHASGTMTPSLTMDSRCVPCPLGTGRHLHHLLAVALATDLDLDLCHHIGHNRGGLRSEEAMAGLTRREMLLLGRGKATSSSARRSTCATWLLLSRQP